MASHILARIAPRISEDWQSLYGHPIYFPETFVDPERFRGTCYRPANWVVMGKTRKLANRDRGKLRGERWPGMLFGLPSDGHGSPLKR